MGCWATGSAGAGGTNGDGQSGNATADPPERVLIRLWPTGQPEVFETLPFDVARITSIGVTYSGASTVTVGALADIWVPFACTIREVRMLATESGSCQIDIWKTPYPVFPATDGNSITASTPPAIVASDSYADSALTGWTTTIAKDDTIRFHVDGATTIKQVVCQLKVERTAATGID